MLGREMLETFGKRLARGSGAVRRRSLHELEALACNRIVSSEEKKILSLVLLANFHFRPRAERRTAARLLDVWLVSETSRRLHRRIESTRLEEMDPETRDSLQAAAWSVIPSRDLVQALARPRCEDLTAGLGLLMALDAAYSRLRCGAFPHAQLPDLIRALKAARAHRASHVAKPFLWRLEYVLETACKVGSYLPEAKP